MEKLLFACPGIPSTTKGGTIEGIREVKRLGLDAMELEFARGVNITEAKAQEIKDTAEENRIILTCHGPYFINLNSSDKKKLEGSKQRMIKAISIAELCGAKSIAFHMGFYMEYLPEETFQNIKRNLQDVMDQIRGNKIIIRPEIMGKHRQFGTVEEIIRLCKEVKWTMPCVDYAHLVGRSNGVVNNYREFSNVLGYIKKELGDGALKDMHIQFAGVNYSEKGGELNHLNIKDSNLDYKEMIKSWKDYRIAGVAVSESPNQERDALLMRSEYNA